MAFSTLEKLLATAVGLDIARPGTSRKAATAAARVLVGSVVAGTPPAARTIGSLAQRSPAGTGAALGLGFLATPPGEALLEMAAERGAADRRALEQAIDERIFAATRVATDPFVQQSVKSTVKRKVSKYSKAVKASMKAVKASKFNGKKGTISNAKKTFGTVNKVVSAVKKGKKVSTKGVTGTIARAARKVFKR
jgi:hypothetical protein